MQQGAVVADTQSLLVQDTPIERIKKKLRLIRANVLLLLSPGDKQFKDLPKRVRLMLISFAIPLLIGALKVFVLKEEMFFPWWVISSLVLGGITYGALYWGLKGQVRKESYFSVLPIATWFVVAYTLFIATTFVTPVNRLFLWFFFVVSLAVLMIILYVLSLAINVLNVTLFYTIPLSRLGETVSYLASVMTVFLVSHSVGSILLPLWHTRDWMAMIPWGILYLIVITGTVSYLWLYFLQLQKGLWTFILAVSSAIVVVFASLFLVLSVPWEIAAMVSAFAYLLLGLIIHKEQNTLKLSVYVELIAIFVALFAFLVLM